MDFLRWVYYHLKLKTGIADTYRYEQFMKKNDSFYDFDHLLLHSNLNSSNKDRVLESLIFIEILLILKFHKEFSNFLRKLNLLEVKNKQIM